MISIAEKDDILKEVLNSFYVKLNSSRSFIFRSFDYVFSFEHYGQASTIHERDYLNWYTKYKDYMPIQIKTIDRSELESVYKVNYFFHQIFQLLRRRLSLTEII